MNRHVSPRSVSRGDTGSRLGCALRGGRNGGNAVSLQARPAASSWAGRGSGWHGRSPPGGGRSGTPPRPHAMSANPPVGRHSAAAGSPSSIPVVRTLFGRTFPSKPRIVKSQPATPRPHPSRDVGKFKVVSRQPCPLRRRSRAGPHRGVRSPVRPELSRTV